MSALVLSCAVVVAVPAVGVGIARWVDRRVCSFAKRTHEGA